MTITQIVFYGYIAINLCIIFYVLINDNDD
jgi:hypothetical protein